MRALVVTHCILLALATGMLASGASPAPTIGGTSTNAGCPASTTATTTGQGRSSGFLGYRLDDTIQPGSSCAWTIEAPTTTSNSVVLVVKRVEDFSANTKITAAMFKASIAAGNTSSNSSVSKSQKSDSDDDDKSDDDDDDRRRQLDQDDDDDDESSKQGSSKSASKSSKKSGASGSSKHSSKSSSKSSKKSGASNDDDDDDDASSKKASSKSNSKSSKKSGLESSKHSSKSASKSSKKSDDDDDEDESSKKGSSKSNSKSSKKSGSGSSKSKSKSSKSSSDATSSAAAGNNGPAQSGSIVLGNALARLAPSSSKRAKLVISTNSAVPASSSASNVVVGVRYTYAEATSLRATLRDVTLSGSQGTLVIGSSSTKRQSTQVTFADAKDSSLVLSCANGDYDVRISSVSGTAADPADSVTFIGDMSQSASTCAYTAPSSSASSSTWTAVHGSQACVGAQFIVNYKTTSKSSGTASVQVDYTCEPEAVAETQVFPTEANKQTKHDSTAMIAGIIIAVTVVLIVIVVVVLYCCLKGHNQEKRRQEVIDAQASNNHNAPVDILSRPTSAMSEDTVVVMAKWDAANEEHTQHPAIKYIADGTSANSKNRDLEIDDGFQVTIGGSEPLGVSTSGADNENQDKKLKMMEDEVVVDGERVSVRRSAPREGFSVPQDPPAQDDEGEEYMRRKSLTRSSVGSCGSYGTADGLTPRPELTLNNDE